MYDNEFRLAILVIGFFIIIYIVFLGKNNTKYPVYKTKNYDIKNPINITTNNNLELNKNIYIDLTSKKNNVELNKDINISANKSKQMTLSLGENKDKKLIIIHSLAVDYYNIKDIYNFMDHKSIFMNDNGYYDKYYIDKHTRCIMYSITNMFEPGYLDKNKLESPKIKGLSFFVQLPIKINSLNVFNEMFNDAKMISKKYKGNLYDEQKNKLNGKIIKNLRGIANSYNYE